MTGLSISSKDYQALEQYVALALSLLDVQIEAIVLFGSKARGDSGADSDTDLLIVLDNDTLVVRERLRGLTFDVLLDTSIYLSTHILSAELFRQLPDRRPLFYANLIRDGIVLYLRPGASLPNFKRRVEFSALVGH